MRRSARIAVLALLGPASDSASQSLVAAVQAQARPRRLVGGYATGPSSIGDGRIAIGDGRIAFDGYNLAVDRVARLEGVGRRKALDLVWRVRVTCPDRFDPDCEVFYEKTYDHQRFRFAPGGVARPTSRDAFARPHRLPPGRYAVALELARPDGRKSLATGQIFDVE